jgi:hypothetical protein
LLQNYLLGCAPPPERIFAFAENRRPARVSEHSPNGDFKKTADFLQFLVAELVQMGLG